MNFIRSVLIGLGLLFLVIVIYFTYMTRASFEFKELHGQFVKEYTRSFSRQWDIHEVSDLTTQQLLSLINTPAGEQALARFRAFGALETISEFELQHYGAQSEDTDVGVFRFKAQFNHAAGLVTVTLYEQDGRILVSGFHIEPMGKERKSRELQGRNKN